MFKYTINEVMVKLTILFIIKKSFKITYYFNFFNRHNIIELLKISGDISTFNKETGVKFLFLRNTNLTILTKHSSIKNRSTKKNIIYVFSSNSNNKKKSANNDCK